MKISVVISAYNEEKNIEKCLQSVKWADEIVVVDDGSSDSTVSLAKKYTNNVFHHAGKGYVEPARNFAIKKATHDWILILDADERVPEELATKLKKIAEKNTSICYEVPRKNIIFGKWIEHTGWWPDFNVRFFKKGKVRWIDAIHSEPEVDGKIEKIETEEKYAIVHHNYSTISQFLNRINKYTDFEKENFIKKGYKFKTQDLLKIPFNEFLSRYFARQGYKDGRHGLALSLLMTFYHLIIILKVWEKEKFEEKEKDTSEIVSKEAQQMKKELKYWLAEIKIKKSTPFKKAIERAKRKFA